MAHELCKRIDGSHVDVINGSLFGNSLTATPPPWLTPTELDALQQQTERHAVWIQRADGIIGSLQQQLHDCVTACRNGLSELRQRCGDVESVLGSTSIEAEGRVLELGEARSESNGPSVPHEALRHVQLHSMVGNIHSELMAERARMQQNVADLHRVEAVGSELSRRLAFTEERLRCASTGVDRVEVPLDQLPKDFGELERMVAQQIGDANAEVQRRIESLEKSCSPALSELTTVRMRISSLERRAILMSPRSPRAPGDGQAREELSAIIQDALTAGLNETREGLRQELVPRVAAAEAACTGGLRHVSGLAAGCAAQLEAMQGEVHRIVIRLSALETPSAPGSVSARGPLSVQQDTSETVCTAGPICKAKEEDTHEKPDPLSTTDESVDAMVNPTSTTTEKSSSPMGVARRRLSVAQDTPNLSPGAPWPINGVSPLRGQPQPPQQRRISPIRNTSPRRESSCPVRLPASQNPGIRRLSSQQSQQGEPLSARGQCSDGGKVLAQRHSDLSPRPARQHVPAAIVYAPLQQCQGSLGHTRNLSPRRTPWKMPATGSSLGITLSGGTNNGSPIVPVPGCSASLGDTGTPAMTSTIVPAPYTTAQR